MADHVDSSRLQRMARLAGVAARTARDVATARVKQKLTGSDELDVGAALEPAAERLVEVLGEMKGAATKLGQFLSLVDQDTFPEQARKALTKLLNQTPQRMTYAQVCEVVQQELGALPEALFATFEPEPFASASMGQVHAATTRDGRDVVVKVQFPGVDKAIEADLRNLGMMTKGLSFAGSLLDKRAYYEEIAATLRRELDYRQEVEQLHVYRAALQPWPDLYVPEVFPELSAARVLTLERLRGPTMLELAQDATAPADVRFRVGAQLVAATWGPFLSRRVIHADPHPGNYVVLADGRLGVLDFGATKELSVPFTVAYWHIIEAAFADRRIDLHATLSGAGFQMTGERERFEAWLQGLSDIVERPFRSPAYDWGACRITVDVRDYMLRHALLAARCRAPEESLMFYRSAAGAAGDLRMLRAHGDFRQVLLDVATTARMALAPEMAAALARQAA